MFNEWTMSKVNFSWKCTCIKMYLRQFTPKDLAKMGSATSLACLTEQQGKPKISSTPGVTLLLQGRVMAAYVYTNCTRPSSIWMLRSLSQSRRAVRLILCVGQTCIYVHSMTNLLVNFILNAEALTRLAQVGGNPQSLTCSWILSPKCVCWDSRDTCE